MLTSVRGRPCAIVRFAVPGFRRAAATLALAGALAVLVAAISPMAAQAQSIDNTWSCSVPSGATWDLTEFRLPCSTDGISHKHSFHLRTPVDNLWACSVPAGFTWDRDISQFQRCSMYAEAPLYHLRKPGDLVSACTVPNGFTYDVVSVSSNCTVDGAGLLYRLRDPAPATIKASQPVVEREPPMSAPVLIEWSARAPVRVYVSVDGGEEALFAPAAASGQKYAQILSPHTYVFRVYGQGNHSHVFATTTVKGTIRKLFSTTPSAARRPDGKIDVFVRGTDGEADMSTLASTGRVITPWASLGRKVLGAPSGTWTNDGRTLDVVAVDTTRHVIHRRYVVGTGWNDWRTLPGMEVGSRTVGVARFAGGLTLLARGLNSMAYWATLASSGSMADWESLGMLTVGAPSGAWTADGRRFEVDLVGNDYVPYRRGRLDGAWQEWQSLGEAGAFAAADTVTMVRRQDSERTLFLLGTDGQLWRRARTPTGDVLYRWQHIPPARGAIGSPAASWTFDGETLDLESVDADNRIARVQRLLGVWRDWSNSQVASATAGLSSDDTRRHVFVRGNDGNALSGELPRSGAAAPWQSMVMSIADAAPAGAWTASGTIRVETAVGTDNRVYWRRTDGAGYTAWKLVPGAPLASSATSIAGYADRVTIAYRNTSNQAVVGWMTVAGQLVRGWATVGSNVLGAPALSWSANRRRLDVVVVAGNGRIYHRRWANELGWGRWREVPGGMISADGTVAVAGYRDPVNGTRRLSIFVRGTDRIARMTTITRSGRVTTAWGSLGKEVLGAPSASWSADGRKLTVAAVGADYLAWHRTWANGVWGPWIPLNTNPASAPYYALPASQPPLLTTLGVRLSGAQASEILARVGEESVTAKPQASGLVAALSSLGATPTPSGSFPKAPSGTPPG
jgi:hypothetical protein